MEVASLRNRDLDSLRVGVGRKQRYCRHGRRQRGAGRRAPPGFSNMVQREEIETK